jgi:tetratricopeptide (TPR) repeat protein
MRQVFSPVAFGDCEMSNAMLTIGTGIGLGFSAAFREKATKACNEGVSMLESGRTDEAIRCFTEAIRFDPSFSEARLKRSVALSGIGELEKAVDDATAIIQQEPSNAEAFLLRAARLGRPTCWRAGLAGSRRR